MVLSCFAYNGTFIQGTPLGVQTCLRKTLQKCFKMYYKVDRTENGITYISHVFVLP